MECALRLRRLCFALSLLACAASVPLHAQNAPPNTASPLPTLTTNAQAVAVDVVVTRGNNDPVAGLHQQDFQIFEDGKPQAIDLFEEHTAPVNAPPTAPMQLPPNVFSNLPLAPQSDAINVLLLDNLNTEPQDQINVRRQIADFAGHMQPGTQVAVFVLGPKLQLAQGFTADASILLAALSSKQFNTPPRPITAMPTRSDQATEEMQQALMATSAAKDAGGPAELQLKAIDRGVQTLDALQQLARYLAGIPGRKNLIWFASAFPISIFPTAREQQEANRRPELIGQMRETAGLLTASKVAVYPIDAQGIHVDRSTDADSSGSAQGDSFSRDAARDLVNRTSNSAAMDQLASGTGGQAFYQSNNLSQSIASAIQNGSHYYTLVYTPPSAQMDGKYHRIEVKLVEGKANLAYRRGYYADSPSTEAKAAKSTLQADPLPALLVNGLPASTQILYQARIVPIVPQPVADAARAGGNGKLAGPLTRYKVDLIINPSTIKLDLAPDLMHNGKIEVAVIAYDQTGKPLNWTGETLGLTLNPASYAQVERIGIPVHLQLDLPAEGLSLATGVYDLAAHKAGTLEIALDAKSIAAQ